MHHLKFGGVSKRVDVIAMLICLPGKHLGGGGGGGGGGKRLEGGQGKGRGVGEEGGRRRGIEI